MGRGGRGARSPRYPREQPNTRRCENEANLRPRSKVALRVAALGLAVFS